MNPSACQDCHRNLKVVLALQNIVHFRYLGEIVQHLCRNGHSVRIVVADDSKKNTTDRFLRACLSQVDSAECEFLPEHWTKRAEWKWRIRNWISYATYFKPQHPSPTLEKRWRKHVPRSLRLVLWMPIFRKLLVSGPVQRVLQRIRDRLPLDPDITRMLEEYQPDIVLATPFLKEDSTEMEFVRSAAMLGIPTVVAVLSWDNLTTKGTFHAIPDMIFVWNQALVEEAVELHHIPFEKIFVTGAPTFDFWFDMRPSLSRQAFCEQVGIEPGSPFIIYLGSSKAIARDETSYVQELASRLREQSDSRIVHVLVRPHPLNAACWKDFFAEDITVWPRGGEWPDSPEAKQDYFNTLYYSDAVMGVNTSGFLDAAVVGRPCVTAVTEHFQRTQTGLGHFAHLIRGDFLEIAHSLSEAASIIAAILRGEDRKAGNRQRFVREFVRPYGLDRRASEIFARAVEMVAEHRSAAQMKAQLECAELSVETCEALTLNEQGNLASAQSGSSRILSEDS